MGLLIVLIIVGVIMLCGGAVLFSGGDDGIGASLMILGIICIITMGIIIPCYYSAGVKAEIVNKKYGTDITRREIFWAGETIESIIKSDKSFPDHEQKITIPEVNVNINKEK